MKRISLPVGSAAWLYQETAAIAECEAQSEDCPASKAMVLRAVARDGRLFANFLTLVSEYPPSAAVLGGTAETASCALEWSAVANAENYERFRKYPNMSRVASAVAERAAQMRLWADIAARVTAPGERNPVAICALYSGLINGVNRLIMQVGPQVLPLLALLVADLQVFSGVDSTLTKADVWTPPLIVTDVR